jgi:hypothetical protein
MVRVPGPDAVDLAVYSHVSQLVPSKNVTRFPPSAPTAGKPDKSATAMDVSFAPNIAVIVVEGDPLLAGNIVC